jgi:hypothetical protein
LKQSRTYQDNLEAVLLYEYLFCSALEAGLGVDALVGGGHAAAHRPVPLLPREQLHHLDAELVPHHVLQLEETTQGKLQQAAHPLDALDFSLFHIKYSMAMRHFFIEIINKSPSGFLIISQ